jgi:hypothetical protein
VESQWAPLCVPVLFPCPLLLFDDAGGKSVSETSKSLGGKCVSENSTGGKSGATRTSNNPFEASRSEKPSHTPIQLTRNVQSLTRS